MRKRECYNFIVKKTLSEGTELGRMEKRRTAKAERVGAVLGQRANEVESAVDSMSAASCC